MFYLNQYYVMLASALSQIENLKNIVDEMYNTDQTERSKINEELKKIQEAEKALNNLNTSLPDDLAKVKDDLEIKLGEYDDTEFKISMIEDELKNLLNHMKKLKRGPPPKNSTNQRRRKYRDGEKTPNYVLAETLLSVLKEMGGSGKVSDIIDNMRIKLESNLTEIDLEEVSKGDLRWSNATKWIRLDLINQGILKNDSPRGVWELKK